MCGISKPLPVTGYVEREENESTQRHGHVQLFKIDFCFSSVEKKGLRDYTLNFQNRKREDVAFKTISDWSDGLPVLKLLPNDSMDCPF